MSVANSETVESSESFDCRNMGDVLGKECEKKDSTLTESVESVMREEAEGATSSGPGSESDSEKDLETDEDLSWLLPINILTLGAKNCKCEGCLKLFESYSSDKKNAKLLLSSWKEFRSYLRHVYINSPLEAIQKNKEMSFENSERLHEIVQVMKLCDPYQLFQKIEEEVCSMVLESRIRQLNMLKDKSNPALAEEFIAGLIEEYVKLLSSALQLSPAMENLLGPQLQRFGLTWEVLNKQLYRSLVYNHFDVQQNLIKFIEHLRKMLPLKEDIYQELVHQYLALDGEMTLVGNVWKKVEPVIQEYRSLKSKENENMNNLNNLLDAVKDFFTNKVTECTEEKQEEVPNKMTRSESNVDETEYCPDCMTKRGCPCNECKVTHMMFCEDFLLGKESSVETPSSRSRSPSQSNEDKDSKVVEGQKPCECHACTVPPVELIDCSVAFNQSTEKKTTHGEGFQLYPHIHGTVCEPEKGSKVYGSLKMTNDSVYPHLYNLENKAKAIDKISSKISDSFRDHLVQAIATNKVNSQSYKRAASPPPPPPPPPPSQESTPSTKTPPKTSTHPSNNSFENSVNTIPPKVEKREAVKRPVEENKTNEPVKRISSEKSKSYSLKVEKSKIEPENKKNKESQTPEKLQSRPSLTSKTNGCLISGLCGKCCLKHGSNCLRVSACSKGTDKHLAAIARLGVSGISNSRTSLRCPGGKDDHTHRTIKTHTCNKIKHQENIKKAATKRSLEMDDGASPEDSCSECSNSTSSTSIQKDTRHCDCCYCEVFGHGVPSVAPVNRNYQEMRERLRLRLNMKKSAKCKALQSGQGTQAGQKTVGTNEKSQVNSSTKIGNKPYLGDQDLDWLLKYIEGKKSEFKDSKKAAKKARQKQKKQEEKERLEVMEEERKRLEAVKRQVTISLVNDKRSQNAKQNPQSSKPPPPPPPAPAQSQRLNQPQTLNLSGLKSLVEKSDPNAVPKMVTIRRVMAPFSTEPTVTITLKGSTPDKDKVLFMLKNGSEAVPLQNETSSKKSKKKKKGKQNVEVSQEPEYEPVYEPPPESVSKKKKKKNKGLEANSVSESVSSRLAPPKPVSTENVSSSKNKSKTSKSNSGNVTAPSNEKTSNSKKNQNATVAKVQPQKSKPQAVTNLKTEPQKNNVVLKNKNQESTSKTNKNNNNVSKKSVQNNSGNQANSVNTKNSVTNKGAGVGNDARKVVTSNTKNTSNDTNQRVKNSKNENSTLFNEYEKSGKQQKNLPEQTFNSVTQVSQTKNKTKSKASQKNIKNINGFLENNLGLHNLEISPVQDKKEKTNKKNKNNKTSLTDDVEVSCKITRERPDNGKVVINTPSYRLSEVLSSIAPSPPPKEEINLENLRLPPGITITKIEGPIQKPIKPSIQPSQVPKPSPPIVMAPPSLKPNPPPGNVIVVDTARIKDVVRESPPITLSTVQIESSTNGKKKKKKNKKQAEGLTPTIEVPINQSKFSAKISKSDSPLSKSGLSVLSSMDARKMVPNLENQQATIIKTSDNMVTIRSPALQQAMNIHAYQNGQSFKPGINGYNNMTLFNEDVSRINEKFGKLNLTGNPDDRLSRQMRNLNIKDGNMLAQAMMAASSQNGQGNGKKKKKKKKQGKSGEEREVEPVESVFQPKDIDLENGDIDDDERELEAFKRFCLQSIPPERKDKVKVNLNIKDIVLKKKSAVGCS